MDEEDIDIYEDLPSFEVKDSVASKELSEKCLKYEEEIIVLKTKLESSEKSRNVMAENLSSLMKTAKGEITRKDKMIAQLRQELDNLTFRRGKHGVRKKPFVNRHVHKEPEKNPEKEKTNVPQIKTEPAKTSQWSDLSEEENEEFGETYQQEKIAKTLFGERLRKRIMLEEEEERAQKQKNGTTLSEKLAKIQEMEEKKKKDANGLIKKENPSLVPFNGITIKKEIINVSSTKEEIDMPIKKESNNSALNISSTDTSKRHRADEKNVCYRGDVETKLFKKKHEALINLAHGIKKPEEDYYRREDSYPHGSNVRREQFQYNYESVENYEHSRITSRYTDRHYKESNRYRDDNLHMRQFDEIRSESIHRSRSSDRRYNEKYSDRNYFDNSNDYREKYERRHEDRRYKEGDWYKCKKETMIDLRERIENKSRDRNDYDNYNEQIFDQNHQRRSSKSRSEKSRSRSSGRSREKELEKKPHSRSKKSRSIERLISVNSIIEEPQKRSRDFEDLKTVGLESTDTKTATGEFLSESVRNDEKNEKIEKVDKKEKIEKVEKKEKIKNKKTSCEILLNSTITKKTEESEAENREMASSNVTVEKIINDVETPAEIPITILENNSKETLITSTVPEVETELASRSYREEEIENIEKFIKDYRETENPWLPIDNEESAERDKSSNSTASIVDALSMDIEELPLDKKSNNIDNPPETSTLNMKDVPDEAKVSSPPETPIDEQNSKIKPETSEISEAQSSTEKHSLDKLIGKQMKRRPRIPCIPIISRYSRKKPSVLTDSGASNCIVESKSTKQNISIDVKTIIENIETRRTSTEKLSAQPIENNTNKTDTNTEIGKLVEKSNNFINNNSASSSELNKKLIDDSRVREDDKKCKIDNKDDTLSVAVSIEVEVEQKPKNFQTEVRESRTNLKSVSTPASNNDCKLTSRKRSLPKEDDTEPKLDTSKCKILVTVRRRRRIHLEDSCTAMTLVPSAHSDTNWKESSNGICTKTEKAELSKLVSEPSAKRQKCPSIEK